MCVCVCVVHSLYIYSIFSISVALISTDQGLSWWETGEREGLANLTPPTSLTHRLSTDILFGKRNGIKTLLVMTGVTPRHGMETAPEEHIPDFHCQSIADVLTRALRRMLSRSGK